MPGQTTAGSINRRRLFAGLSGVAVAIFAIFGWVMYDARQNVRRDLAAFASSLAAAVAHDVDRNLELLDLSIQSVTETWGDAAVQALDPALRSKVLFDHSLTAVDVGSIIVIDAGGMVRADAKDQAKVGLYVGDRDFFRVHASNGNVGLFVSKPFIGRITGTWQIGLSRRITTADGSFGGVVVGTLQLSYLNKLYKGLNLEAGGSVTLLRTDGTVMTREPYVESDIRRSLGGADSFGLLRSSRAGAFEGASPIDGKRRLISFHRVGSLPLRQEIEVSTDQAFADWLWKTSIIGAILCVLCLILLALVMMLNAELKRRVAAEAILEQLAATDPLTQIANRRRFGEALNVEWRRAIRERLSICLLMIDADHFKAFNDTYGHPMGDVLLVSIASCLTANLRRPADLAARYGGEEFAVVLPNTDAAGALKVAEDIRASIQALARPHAGSPSGVFTISIGIAARRPAVGQSSDNLVDLADAALYRAKAEGRNCCRAAVPQRPVLAVAS